MNNLKIEKEAERKFKALGIVHNKKERNTLASFFNRHFQKIFLEFVNDGKEAIDKFFLSEIPYLITFIDTSIEEESLEHLFKEICELNEIRPVIFINRYGQASDLIPHTIYNMNVTNAVLRGPLDENEFVRTVSLALGSAQKDLKTETTFSIQKEACLPMNIRNFYRSNKLPCDAYMEVSPRKLIKIIEKDTPYQQSDIKQFAKKNVKFLYLEKGHHLDYLEKTIKSLRSLLKKRVSKYQEIITAQIRSCSIIHELIKTVGTDQQVLVFTSDLIVSIIKTFEAINSFSKLFKIFPFISKDVIEQSILSAYVCLAILKTLKCDSDLSKKKLCLAAIIHDVLLPHEEMTFISSLEDWNLKKYGKEMQEGFKEHPRKAAEISSYFTDIPETEFILSQHHELPNRKGFPQGLSSMELTQLSCTFIVATNFVTEISKKEINKNSKKYVFRYFQKNYNEGNFRQVIKALFQVFHFKDN